MLSIRQIKVDLCWKRVRDDLNQFKFLASGAPSNLIKADVRVSFKNRYHQGYVTNPQISNLENY